jgi:hypothetical protein
VRDAAEECFVEITIADPTVRAFLERAPALGLPDCGRTPAHHRSRARGGALQGAVYDDLFAMTVRPNRRHFHEAKAARWVQQWPELTVLPWDGGLPASGGGSVPSG